MEPVGILYLVDGKIEISLGRVYRDGVDDLTGVDRYVVFSKLPDDVQKQLDDLLSEEL